MKQRGRHRRQRRGQAVRGFLAGTALALTAAATMISASQATVSDSPGGLKPLAADAKGAGLRLQERLVPQDTLDRLSSSMGKPVGVRAVLDDTDRTLRGAADCTTTERSALPVEPTATRAYCFDTADTSGWQAGAVTTSGDADNDGHWGENRVILSGWSHDTEHGKGTGLARVAFVNADDPAHLTYTWALLVVPTDGGRDYRGLSSAVSGMVWYQGKLLVTTTAGLYVYDMRRVQRAGVDSGKVGKVRGGWAAYGYRYVLPAIGSYALGSGSPRPTAISLDRSTAPDSLVASERVPVDGDLRTRLWRYALSSDPARAGLPAVDSAGYAIADAAYETKVTGVAGVLSHGSTWYLDRAADTAGDHGTLWRQDAHKAKTTECGSDASHQCWSGRAGSLSYWAETGEVWSQSGRMLYALPLASIDKSAG
ncbi:hypothetical protein [Streptomyces pseudovenezuelae]|uniref:Secreted protein n=1 Tax=Streptomyces pseudovenezuelae TaxID=67350 RepID=A0ABT6LBD3_9ACTN|nr:hypothetical protein [Streptomyces pseudovenezuelae]MDH6213597.1 hypothetical protein [Streptomyces pseudovenezuelae]